jgi:hypothetical protein
VDANKLVIGPEEFVAVFLGKNQEENSEFAQHPRVQWIKAHGNGVTPVDVLKNIPQAARAFIMTEGIHNDIFHQIKTEAQRRQVLYLNRKNPRAVLGTLYELFPKANGKMVEVVQEKGFLQKFLKEHPPDLKKGNTEEARRLQLIAKEHGVVTTLGSLQQAISVMKRKKGYGEIPESIQKAKRDPVDNVLQQLDDAMAALQLIHDWVASTVVENRDLRKQLATIKEALGMKV